MSDLRIAVLGVGMMGADHVALLSTTLGSPARSERCGTRRQQVLSAVLRR